MQATEILNEKLKREYRVCVPAAVVAEKAEAFVREKGKNYKAPGFRPGKVPLAQLTHIFYPQAFRDALDEILKESSQEVFKTHDLQPALRPTFHLESAGEGKDFEYRMAFEILPVAPDITWDGLEVTQHKVVVSPAYTQEQLEEFVRNQKTSKPLETPRPAQNGDTLFLETQMRLKSDKEPQHLESIKIELGEGRFKPEIEEKFVGLSQGDTLEQEMLVPPEIKDRKLVGKPLIITFRIADIHQTVPCEVNEELATSLGFENLEALRQDFQKTLEQKGSDLSFMVLKRQILDYLSDKYIFEVPEQMVAAEFESIWEQLLSEMKISDSGAAANENQSPEEREKAFQAYAEKSEAALREEYQKIAERRVRLGVVLSAIGTQHKVFLSPEEVSAEIYKRAMSSPGREKEVVAHYRNSKEAVLALQAPLFENKIIKHIVSHLSVVEKEMSLKELEDYFEKNMDTE